MTRIDQLDQVIAACGSWPRFAAEIQTRIDDLTLRLIGVNDEQVRGAIKELRSLIDLPATLQSERDHLAVALSEQSDAA